MKGITLLFLIFVAIASGSAAVAQDNNLMRDLVRKTRALKVSTLERHMPPVPLDQWFQKAVGTGSQVTWVADNCAGGPPDFTRLDKAKGLCVAAECVITDQLSATVTVEYLTMVNDQPAGPRLARVNVGDDDFSYGDNPGALIDLPKRIGKIRRSLVFVDPGDGMFNIADLGEWEGVIYMSVDTDRSSRGRLPNVWKKGQMVAGDSIFPTLRNYYDGKRWSFETVKVAGVSFKFDGKFAKTVLRENGDTDDQHVLFGHMIKYVKGKIAAESDLTFSFEPYRDAP